MRKNLISLEDIPIDETCLAIHNPDEIIANDLMEMHEQTNNIDIIQDSIEEATDVAITLESIADKLKEEQLIPSNAKILNTVIEHFCTRVNYTKKTFPAMESFGGTMTKAQGTSIALEFIKETAIAIWEAIKAAFKKMWEWITDFFQWIFGSNNKQVIKLEKIKSVDELVNNNINLSKQLFINKQKNKISSNVVIPDNFVDSIINKHNEKIKNSELKNTPLVKKEKILGINYDENKKIELKNSPFIKYLNCKNFGQNFELYTNTTSYFIIKITDAINKLSEASEYIDKDTLNKKNYLNEITRFLNDLKNNNSNNNSNDLNEIAKKFHFNITKNVEYIVFPFEKLVLSIDKKINELYKDETSPVNLKIDINLKSYYMSIDETNKTEIMYAANGRDFSSIIKDCLEFIDKVDYKKLQKSLTDGLKKFEMHVTNISKNSNEISKDVEMYCIFVKKFYASLLIIIKDIVKYIHATNAAVISYLEESVRVKKEDYLLWHSVNIN